MKPDEDVPNPVLVFLGAFIAAVMVGAAVGLYRLFMGLE